jgi:hypothetical protein
MRKLSTGCLFLILLAAVAAHASTIALVGNADVCLAQNSTNPIGCSAVADILDLVQGPTGSASLNTTLAASGSSITAAASGTATYGVLHASVSNIASIGATPTLASVGASAYFEDVLTANDSALTGQQGLLILGYSVDGTFSVLGELAVAHVGVSG